MLGPDAITKTTCATSIESVRTSCGSCANGAREAAKRLKFGLSSLYRKIEELGIDL